MTSYTATPAGKSTQEKHPCPFAGAAFLWRSNRIIITRDPIPQSLTPVTDSSLCNLDNVPGLCKKIKMRNRNKEEKGLERGKIRRRKSISRATVETRMKNLLINVCRIWPCDFNL